MGDLIVLFVILVLPAAVVLGPLAILTLSLAAVADVDGNGSFVPRPRRVAGVSLRPGRCRASSRLPDR